MAHDAFISYSASNQAEADRACAALESSGVRCWIAPRDIPPAMSWGGAKADAVAQSRAMVVIFSGDANASPQVQRDLELAAEAEMGVIVWRVEPGAAVSHALQALLDKSPCVNVIDAPADADAATAALLASARAAIATTPPPAARNEGSAPASDVLQDGATRLPPPIPPRAIPLASHDAGAAPAPRPVIPATATTAQESDDSGGEMTGARAPLPRRQPPPLPSTSAGVSAGFTARRRTWSRWRVPAAVSFLLVAGGTGAGFMALRGGHPAPASAMSPANKSMQRTDRPPGTPVPVPSTSVAPVAVPAPQTQPVRVAAPARERQRPSAHAIEAAQPRPGAPVDAKARRAIDPFADDDAPGTGPSPAAPATATPADPDRAAAMRAAQALRLQTILLTRSRKTCLINGRTYTEGASVGGFTIERITESAVIVRQGRYRFELTMNK